MAKPKLVSGIQPSGRLHLGNYLGALKNFVELQNSGDYECLFFIADYHSLTKEWEGEKKREAILDLAKSYLAAGLDPEKSVIFQQSEVSEHTNLAWILSCLAPCGRMQRMTQFKEKSETQKENINLGLFSYPVLMAADILLYGAGAVPVGEDQFQHLELTRDLARKFNSRFGKTFPEPEPIQTETPRLMSLQNPKNKMSKSQPKGCLFLDDSPEDIKKKITSAVTDSSSKIKYDKNRKPAVSNLMLIYSALSDLSLKEIEKKYKGDGYAEFKGGLTNVVTNSLSSFRKAKKELKNKDEKVLDVLNRGNKKAGKLAKRKMKKIKKKIGLLL